MTDKNHNKSTRKRIKDLFVTEDEYLEAKKAQAMDLLKDAKNGKSCRDDEEKVDGKCKKKYGVYSRDGKIRLGYRLPDYRDTNEVGDDDTVDSTDSTVGDAGDAGGDAGGGE